MERPQENRADLGTQAFNLGKIPEEGTRKAENLENGNKRVHGACRKHRRCKSKRK